MRYIDWNIKCYCDVNKIIDELQIMATPENCIIALQEVMPDRAAVIRECMSQNYHIVYSTDYRQPDDEFDTDNRRLGVMFLVSKDMEIASAGVFNRCLFPERTLWIELNCNGRTIRAVTFHSVTGVSFKMGKAVQFRSFAECIRDYRPDFVSLDANEPKCDHYDLSQMEFFDQGDSGRGAKVFFDQVRKQNLVDVYASVYDTEQFINGEPLAVSHVLPNGVKRRYDFIFAQADYKIENVSYLYDEACRASSDHAIVVADLKQM